MIVLPVILPCSAARVVVTSLLASLGCDHIQAISRFIVEGILEDHGTVCIIELYCLVFASINIWGAIYLGYPGVQPCAGPSGSESYGTGIQQTDVAGKTHCPKLIALDGLNWTVWIGMDWIASDRIGLTQFVWNCSLSVVQQCTQPGKKYLSKVLQSVGPSTREIKFPRF